jgi:hypothetical protein
VPRHDRYTTKARKAARRRRALALAARTEAMRNRSRRPKVVRSPFDVTPM